MPLQYVPMKCLVCGHEWNAEADEDFGDESGEAGLVIHDDLCPECDAQGEIVDAEVEEE